MRKIIFIDRDGVVNKDPGGWTEHGYVTKWEYFEFLPGSKNALKRLTEAGYDIIIISNQAGIAKGYYSEKELEDITKKMISEIENSGGRISKVYYCPHQDKDNCVCRKPLTGMLKRCEKELGVKITEGYLIGDKETDVRTGRDFGLKTILVMSGMTKDAGMKGWKVKPDYVFRDLDEAVTNILERRIN